MTYLDKLSKIMIKKKKKMSNYNNSVMIYAV